MFTNSAHTATRNAVSAERWCAYSLPNAIALFGAARLASEGGESTCVRRMSLVPQLAIGSKDLPPGAFV